MNQFSHIDHITVSKRCCGRKKGGAADLQEHPHHGEPVGLTGGLAEAAVFGVPVHQVELQHTRNPIINYPPPESGYCTNVATNVSLSS